jgi:hypothetical protein
VKSLEDSNVLVVSVVRNVARHLSQDVSRINEAISGANSVSWFVVESDSTDKTLDYLTQLSETDEDFAFISLGVVESDVPRRTERLAHCRNAYLDHLKKNPKYDGVDYVIVADLDGLNRKISSDGFESCWAHDDWAVMTANQTGPYYDMFALRHEMWSPINPLAQYEFLSSIDKRRRRNWATSVRRKMLRVPTTLEPIEVVSAFGGFAVYSRDALLGAKYNGLSADGAEDCEHVSLHQQIRSKGHRILINPKMINAHYTEHSSPLWELVSIMRRLKLRITKFFVSWGRPK